MNVICMNPDSKVHVTIMGPTWVLPAPGGPHIGPTCFAIRINTVLALAVMVLHVIQWQNHQLFLKRMHTFPTRRTSQLFEDSPDRVNSLASGRCSNIGAGDDLTTPSHFLSQCCTRVISSVFKHRWKYPTEMLTSAASNNGSLIMPVCLSNMGQLWTK